MCFRFKETKRVIKHCIHLANVLTDYFSNSLSEKTTMISL